MKRPYVKLETENIIGELRSHLQDTLTLLKALPGVVGVTLNGGMSRGYADYLSEIDVTIFLDSSEYEKLKNGQAPIFNGIVKLNGYLYDIKYVNWNSEIKKSWNDIELWDLSYAEILYDPYGKIDELFQEKLRVSFDLDRMEGFLFNCWWHFKFAGDIWIHRGDVLQGQLMFNEAVKCLIKALFALNKEFIPHEKWIIHMSRSLNWKPVDWENRLTKVMDTGDMTVRSLRDRQKIIQELWNEIDNYVVESNYPDLPINLMQKSFYDLLQVLAQQKIVPKIDWESISSLELLNNEPFHSVVTVEEDKFLDISVDDLYSWH
ncbi:MAG: DUF4037 domain-containing protein [Halanaerobiales bacterium]|nr:DUF4037 domain-containing protein [Halanaerobiales bacterium]